MNLLGRNLPNLKTKEKNQGKFITRRLVNIPRAIIPAAFSDDILKGM